MRKAYDSVSLEMLQLALRRIKAPKKTIGFVLSIFNKRQMQMITKEGLMNPFVAEDGIDQGEVLFPLMWRVFYDPLLYKVQKEEGLGYIAEVQTPVDSRRGTWSVERVRQAAIAYANDTIWLGKSKEEMESILAIANEFFVINDIQLKKANASFW